MAARIRLSRVGRKKIPAYRIVVTDSQSPRDGRFIEIVGHYDARKGIEKAVVKKERVAHWMGKGALPTGIVRQILKHQNP